MDTEPIQLLDTAGGPVPATLYRQMTLDQVIAAEASWKPHRRLTLGQHVHWDWVLKYGLFTTPDVRFVGIECGGDWQGLMQYREFGRYTRQPPDAGLPLVYIDFLEAAPWNTRGFAGGRRYKMVGIKLVQFAVEASIKLGASGRIGLHALTQSVGFYERDVGLTPLGPDPGYNGMPYYELPAADVPALLAKGYP
jgi:hypothetical protein